MYLFFERQFKIKIKKLPSPSYLRHQWLPICENECQERPYDGRLTRSHDHLLNSRSTMEVTANLVVIWWAGKNIDIRLVLEWEREKKRENWSFGVIDLVILFCVSLCQVYCSLFSLSPSLFLLVFFFSSSYGLNKLLFLVYHQRSVAWWSLLPKPSKVSFSNLWNNFIV